MITKTQLLASAASSVAPFTAARSAQKLIETNLVAAMKANPADVKAANALYHFTVTELGGGDATGQWTIDCRGEGSVKAGLAGDADCTARVSEQNLFKLIDGSLSPTGAILWGKLKVSNLGVAQRIVPLLQKTSLE